MISPVTFSGKKGDKRQLQLPPTTVPEVIANSARWKLVSMFKRGVTSKTLMLRSFQESYHSEVKEIAQHNPILQPTKSSHQIEHSTANYIKIKGCGGGGSEGAFKNI